MSLEANNPDHPGEDTIVNQLQYPLGDTQAPAEEEDCNRDDLFHMKSSCHEKREVSNPGFPVFSVSLTKS